MSPTCATLLAAVVLPLWTLAGWLDWWCHRRSGIERTSGLAENHLHLLLFGVVGIGWLLGALFKLSAAVLALLFAVFLLHEALTWLELRLVSPLRVIAPLEQMVHSFLELLPLVALSMLVVDYALGHAGNGSAGWTVQLRATTPALLLCVAAALVGTAPLLEEWRRCRSFTRRAGTLPE